MKEKKTKKSEPKPEDFETPEEALEAMEEYNSKTIINYFQFFFGNKQKVERNRQEGKPNPPY